MPLQRESPVVAAAEGSAITIGEALEAAAQTMGHKPVDQSDAAAIQAAEVRATGSNEITPGGLAASAQSAAAHNEQVVRDEDKIKLCDILTVWLILSVCTTALVISITDPLIFSCSLSMIFLVQVSQFFLLLETAQDATAKLPADKVATGQDAEGVISAELRNNPILATQPGGVAASVAAAARLNESVTQ